MFDYQNLNSAQKQAIARALILENPYIKQTPHPKQMEFLLNFKTEVLFGGSAGGSKSSALLMSALMFVGFNDYNAIIFRKTYSDLALPGALISRSHEWLEGTDARWIPTEHKWIFPSRSTLSFGYLDSENAKYRYQGSEFQFIGVDESTQHKEDDYLYLFSRLRKNVDSNVPLRMRAASNPGGIGHDWNFRRFFVDVSPDREFIPSKLSDNPSINQEEYIKSLQNLDPITRQQLLDGNWTVLREGRKFKREWFDNSYIDVDQVPAKGLTVRYWDLAATEPKKGQDPDWTVGAKVKLYNGIYYILDIQRLRGSPGDVEERIRSIARMDGNGVLIFIEQEPGASGKIVIDDYVRRVLSGYAAYGDKPTGNKEVRANVLSSAAYNGYVKIVRAPWNSALIDELIAFPDPNIHDDQIDGLSGCVSKLTRREADNSVGQINGIYDSEKSLDFGDRLSYSMSDDLNLDDVI